MEKGSWLEYSYDIAEELDDFNSGRMTASEWNDKGSLCIRVEYESNTGVHGEFYVNHNDLENFAERTIDTMDTNAMMDIFGEMLECENYVENTFMNMGDETPEHENYVEDIEY